MEAANTLFTENQLITKASNLVFVAGVYNDACKEWRRKSAADKTWLNFCMHFTDAHEELMELQEAAQQAGYTTNMAEIIGQEQTAEALSQLYAVTEEDRSTMSNLTNTNTQLTKCVANLTTKLNAKDEEIRAPQHSIEELTTTMRTFTMANMMQHNIPQPNMIPNLPTQNMQHPNMMPNLP
eukprot:888333-Ditylum_brightwellii.AAC.1